MNINFELGLFKDVLIPLLFSVITFLAAKKSILYDIKVKEKHEVNKAMKLWGLALCRTFGVTYINDRKPFRKHLTNEEIEKLDSNYNYAIGDARVFFQDNVSTLVPGIRNMCERIIKLLIDYSALRNFIIGIEDGELQARAHYLKAFKDAANIIYDEISVLSYELEKYDDF